MVAPFLSFTSQTSVPLHFILNTSSKIHTAFWNKMVEQKTKTVPFLLSICINFVKIG